MTPTVTRELIICIIVCWLQIQQKDKTERAFSTLIRPQTERKAEFNCKFQYYIIIIIYCLLHGLRHVTVTGSTVLLPGHMTAKRTSK